MGLQQFLERTGRAGIRRGRPILAAAGAVVLLSAVGASRLGVETDIAALLPPDNRTAQSFTRITEDFQTTSSLIVAVRAGSVRRESLIGAAEAFAARIREDADTSGLVASVQLKANREFAETWGFLLQDEEALADTHRITASTRLLPLLRATNDLLEEKLSDGSDEEVEGPEGEDESYALMSRMALFAEALRKDLEERPGAPTPAEAYLFGEEYFIDPEGRTLLLMVRPNFDLGDRAKLKALSDGARRIGDEIQAQTEGVAFSFTGDVENEADEERAISSDLFYPSLIALAAILALFFFSFNRRRSILFATISLSVGILADLAFAAVTVGKLNMITSSFGALLVGLGIDFGIHIVSRYDEAVQAGADREDAMGETFAALGSPIVIGGLTTALAFYVLTLSRTLAFRQFGLVAGTGILLTLASSFTVLPALLSVFPGRPRTQKRGNALRFALPARIADAARRRRWMVVAGAAALAALAVPFLFRNSFEYDMRKIGPQGTAAQETERLVGERFGISTWPHMVAVDTAEEARALAERFRAAPMVRRVESIGDYLPSDEDQQKRLALIAGIAAQGSRLGGVESSFRNEEDLRAFAEEIERLEWNMIELGDLAAASRGEDSLPVRRRNAMIREIYGSEVGRSGEEVFRRLMEAVEALPPGEALDRLSELDGRFAADLDRRISRLAAAARPLTLADIPAELRDEVATEDGSRFLVVVQGSAELAGEASYLRFADTLMEVHPEATGALTLGLVLSREVLREARSSAFLVAAVVVLLVALGFRSLKATLTVTAVLGTGILWMFALYPAFGSFNIVNALALPLIIGIGIDYCVHIASALQEGGTRSEAFRKTVKAVTLSALTTGIGFGSLALAGRFRGIADLGTTLTIGILCCYAAAVFLIPACLAPPAGVESTVKE